jgi:hypothetical protein
VTAKTAASIEIQIAMATGRIETGRIETGRIETGRIETGRKL